MSTTKKTQTTAPKTSQRKTLADYKDATVTPLIQEYADWITANTGVKVDAQSVFLSSALRTRFQAERREVKKAPAKATPKAAPKRPTKAGFTIATSEGVIIAEQRHIDATKAV